jgi:pimeloyl-ACP methyl ester carboxylesterase
MKYFIALDTNSYKIKKGIKPVNLTWNDNTIKDWCEGISFTRKDIVIGHSLGASIALIVAEKTPPRKLLLYSPSPIFTETIKFLDKKNLKHFGKKRRKEVNSIPRVSCPVIIYIGSKELPFMKKNAIKIHNVLPQSKLIVVPKANHAEVISRDDISPR